LKLECADKYDIGFIGSSYFLGMVISLLLFPRLSEIYGRIKIIYTMAILGFISETGILFFSFSLKLLYYFYFLNGCAATIAVCVGYNYLMEFLP
jgi:MFS family permease